MLVVSHFTVPPGDGPELAGRAADALAAFAARPGYRRGWFARATDDASACVVVTEWDGVGAYRRSLSSYDVKVAAAPLLSLAEPGPSAFEVLHVVDAAGVASHQPSGRAADAGEVAVGRAAAAEVPPAG
ncbi:MAG: antibiotic biosynthesis monooxygenase [Actinomycetota bacterium]|nr:antibiotic biosynthesis monooxygenase [Actinomycetota bacterium]